MIRDCSGEGRCMVVKEKEKEKEKVGEIDYERRDEGTDGQTEKTRKIDTLIMHLSNDKLAKERDKAKRSKIIIKESLT